MLLQNGGPYWVIVIIYVIVIAFIVGLILLKIGLVISKAETRTGFKWLLGSFGIQVGMFFFVGSPLILLGISGAFGEQGPEIILIIIFLVLALFIEVNLLNIIHRLGLKRALLVFALMVAPFLIVSFSIIALIVQFTPT
ncbi:MAG: hypothetical protein EU529_10010 [Promethearchaeota archaeon]|nr:MAG: hypothetical protein EU529_10010 [Candidatus Lokiarchaeota archaeon]